MEPVELIANNKIVEAIVNKINRNEKPENLKDLIQDVYLTLLLKPPEFILGLIDRQEINFYVANIVYTQIRSKTSPYHRTYRRHNDYIDELNIQLQAK